jgi:cyclic 2,3-diphosphoglycerate synthetase
VTRAVALIDGEHYPPVVRDALAALPYEWVGAILVGGTEKLREEVADYGVPLVDDLGEAEVVVDLSDEPVLGPVERFEWASRALAAGLSYVGADFRFDPPELEPFPLPSISVIGTGKRVGKTAVTVHLARVLARDRSVVVVAMGRGGPPEPELVARSEAGRHAASDHLEIAALAGVPTIGCRRAGGGLAGGVAVSNVAEGARLAAELRPDVVLFDGSGASIPPVATARRVLVTGQAARDPYLDTYRRLVSDVVIERPTLRLRPTAPLEGRVAVFTAGATEVAHLDADVVHVSANLSNRARLRDDLVEADTYLVEVKAAGIDVVASHALANGIRVVLAGNDVAGIDDEALLALAPVGVA